MLHLKWITSENRTFLKVAILLYRSLSIVKTLATKKHLEKRLKTFKELLLRNSKTFDEYFSNIDTFKLLRSIHFIKMIKEKKIRGSVVFFKYKGVF